MRTGTRWLIGATGATIFLLLLGFMLFAAAAMRTPVDNNAAADGIVVLTGTESRIIEGARLLKEGRAKRMLISGVNRQTSRHDLQRISGIDEPAFFCCVDLGYEALDTIGNADETRHWVRDLKFRSIIVVTSSYHMPRSITELRLAMPEIALEAHPVQSKNARPDAWWLYARTTRVLVREYLKYLPAMARYAVSQLIGPRDTMRSFNPFSAHRI